MSFVRFILILAISSVAIAGDAPSAGKTKAAPESAKSAGTTAPAAADDDVREVLLMLDESPLHLRFHLTLSGISLAAARDDYVDRLMQKLDSDGDGKLSPEEAARSPLATGRRRGSAGAFLNSLDGNRSESRREIRKDIMQQVERVGGEIVKYRQDTSASNNDKEVFKFLDADGSGYIDKAEMAAATARILERDLDQDECISFQEFLPVVEPDPQQLLLAPRRGANDRPAPIRAELLRDISEPSLPVRLIKKYDRNRDGKLTAEELGWEAQRVKMLDSNSDGKLSQSELARIAQTPVDLELAVDLAGPPEGKSALVILSTVGARSDDAKRPDVLRLVFSKAVLTFSFRKIDPIKMAIDNAMRGFNTIDADRNGYLDKQETAMLVRFVEGGLFDDLDTDSDGKIFGEEMEKYVTVRGEPAATSARINVYDTGRGFFESLDTNGDGRISMREMKAAGKSLSSMSRRNSDKLSPEDPARNFHIEFMRGSFVLFGPADQMAAQTPSFEQRSAIGPSWFQRMDRNNDGDLTWNEFLGPREVFHRIDKDGDGLIDPQEAEEAQEE